MVTLEDQLNLILAPSEQEPLAKNLETACPGPVTAHSHGIKLHCPSGQL